MGYGQYTRDIDGVERNLGYYVVARCDHPVCDKVIDRGLGYLCGRDPGETEVGCGRYFCGAHLGYRVYGRGKEAPMVQNCVRCRRGRKPFPMKPDMTPAEVEEHYLGAGHGV